MVVRNDLVKGVFGRLGMVGATLIASALIFGAIAQPSPEPEDS